MVYACGMGFAMVWPAKEQEEVDVEQAPNIETTSRPIGLGRSIGPRYETHDPHDLSRMA